MSAICGVVHRAGRPVHSVVLAPVLDALRGLGPDGGGTWAGAAGPCNVAIGAALRTRTPEDGNDRQPLVSDDGSLVIVADARLDNRRDLLSTLRVRSTEPDSRLIAAAYGRWGRGCVERLVGVFAFALVDRRRGGVLLARDHTGNRPLVVYEGNGVVAFSSTALALTALPAVGHDLDEQWVREILALTYTDRTYVDSVRWVPPAHAVWIDADGARRWAWWDPDPEHVVDLGGLQAHAVRLGNALDEAVAGQLHGAETVGAFVSGGLDSPSVAAAVAGQIAPGPLRTYTSAPPPEWDGPTPRNWDADESALVRDLAACYPNMEPTFLQVPEAALFDGRYERYWELGAGPPRNPCNMLWTDAVYEQAAADGVATVFCGDLGNLAFSADGPDWLMALLRRGQLGEVAREALAFRAHKPLASTLRGDLLGRFQPSWLRRARTRRGLRADIQHDWLSATALQPQLHPTVDLVAAMPQLDVGRHVSGRVSLFAMRAVVAGQADLMAATQAVWRVDRRDPTADRRVLDVAMTQPEWVRRRRGVNRAVAREAMRDRLPASILWRTRRGSQLPDWLDHMTRARAEIETELDALRDHPTSRRVIDAERLTTLVRQWPEPAHAADTRTVYDYRFALLRALVVSRYLRWFEDHACQKRAP
ncbi:MAG: hypothetical protein QOD63_1875 [Actinomycetota bacterium]|nr:hypothetical protein [Actinomycetota bacterium]